MNRTTFIYPLFTISGFAAILYQLIWQRALFTIYGTSIESVTVVVTAFMLGLGFGSLLGGAISKKQERPLLAIFGFFELGIGIFGLLSLRIFHWVGSFTLNLSTMQIGVVALAMLLIPTLMMGATLPILVSRFVADSGNVGRTVGNLYFVNTLGSGLGCLISTFLIFKYTGETGAVIVAAILNLIVGLTVLFQRK